MGSGLWNSSYYIPHHPETTGLKERWDEHLMSQLWFQLGNSALKWWGSVMQNIVYTLIQGPRYSIISLKGRTNRSQSQRVAVGMPPLTITSVIHSTHKILLPIIGNLSSAPLEVLDPKEEKLPPEEKNRVKTNTKSWCHWIRNWDPSLAYYILCVTELTDKKRELCRHGETHLVLQRLSQKDCEFKAILAYIVISYIKKSVLHTCTHKWKEKGILY